MFIQAGVRKDDVTHSRNTSNDLLTAVILRQGVVYSLTARLRGEDPCLQSPTNHVRRDSRSKTQYPKDPQSIRNGRHLETPHLWKRPVNLISKAHVWVIVQLRKNSRSKVPYQEDRWMNEPGRQSKTRRLWKRPVSSILGAEVWVTLKENERAPLALIRKTMLFELRLGVAIVALCQQRITTARSIRSGRGH